MRAREISFELADLTSGLKTIAEALGKAHVNIATLCIVKQSDSKYTTVRMLVDDVRVAKDALAEASVTVGGIRDVVIAWLPNRPGALAAFLTDIVKSGIQIKEAYFLGDDRGRGGVVISTDDIDKLEGLTSR